MCTNYLLKGVIEITFGFWSHLVFLFQYIVYNIHHCPWKLLMLWESLLMKAMKCYLKTVSGLSNAYCELWMRTENANCGPPVCSLFVIQDSIILIRYSVLPLQYSILYQINSPSRSSCLASQRSEPSGVLGTLCFFASSDPTVWWTIAEWQPSFDGSAMVTKFATSGGRNQTSWHYICLVFIVTNHVDSI